MLNVKSGDRLRCIDDKFEPDLLVNYDNLPRTGMSYTVDKLSIHGDMATFKELPNPDGMWFRLDRFEYPDKIDKPKPKPPEGFLF